LLPDHQQRSPSAAAYIQQEHATVRHTKTGYVLNAGELLGQQCERHLPNSRSTLGRLTLTRATLPLGAATWARRRGWALWKALITFAGNLDADPAAAAIARHVIDEVLTEHGRSA
jgi:aminoglycoside phosphotransferase (APT) family kinase protein